MLAEVSPTLPALVRASHPEPTVAVTALTAALFLSAGNSAGVCLTGTLAVLTGQLSIGWSNDLIDRDRDLATARADKPAATGALAVGTLRAACLAALVLTVPLSLALGWRAGLLHLTAVGAGWAYNARLKSGPLSPLPYLWAFAALPAIATLALPAPRWPPAWIVLAAGLIGAAAHLANVLPDLQADDATGVRGLPQRLGLRISAWASAALTVAVGVIVAVHVGLPLAALALAVLALSALGLRTALHGRPAVAFPAIMLSAAVGVVMIVAGGALGRR
jgi:4-hydroxybenzoate polyprenyltransferase